MKYKSLIFLLLIPILVNCQEEITLHKQDLMTTSDDLVKEQLLLKILEYYTQPGGLDRDSIKKYNEWFLNILTENSPTENKVLADSYSLLSDYKMPYDEYAERAKKNINDYEALENYEGVLKAHYYLSSKATRSGKEEGLEMYKKGLELTNNYEDYLSIDILCRYRSTFLSGIASNYERRMLFEQAISFALESVENAELCGDSLSQLYAYRSAGAILGNAENKVIQIENSPLDISLELKRLLNKTLQFSKHLNHDVIYTLASYNLALYHYRNKSIDLAINYLMESESIEDLQWVPKQRYFNQILLSDIFQEKGQTKESFRALENAYHATVELNDPYYNHEIIMDYARWYNIEKQYSKSLSYLKMIEVDDVKNIESIQRYFKELHKTEKAQGNFENALYANEQYHFYRDSINRISSERSISKLMGQYKISKANEEIALLKSDQLSNKLEFQRKAGFGVLSFLFIIGLVGAQNMGYKQNLLKSKEEHQKVQQQLFRAQMNPHFIFNTLGSIQSFLLHPDKSKDAAYFLTKFAKLMRQILTQSQQDLIPLQEEVKTLENYLMLQRMRFENRFDYSINVSSSINQEILIPPMLVQPLVENTIEHGKIYNLENGHVGISIQESGESYIVIEIKDNGVGIIASSDNKHTNKSSLSTSIIRQRLNALNQQNNEIIPLSFESPAQGGTIVKITIPKVISSSPINDKS